MNFNVEIPQVTYLNKLSFSRYGQQILTGLINSLQRVNTWCDKTAAGKMMNEDGKEMTLFQKHKNQGFQWCKEFLGGSWSNIEENDFIFTKLSGGLTNLLYTCELSDNIQTRPGEARTVLLRVYGDIAKDLKFLVQNSVVFCLLSEKHLGPKCYGLYPDGRIEEYIPTKCLQRQDLHNTEISKQIARKLAVIHNLDMPLCKEPKFLKELMRQLNNNSVLTANKHLFTFGLKQSPFVDIELTVRENCSNGGKQSWQGVPWVKEDVGYAINQMEYGERLGRGLESRNYINNSIIFFLEPAVEILQYIWRTDWMAEITNNTRPDDSDPNIKKITSYNLESELSWLLKKLEDLKSPVVFSHNDLQEGNLLYFRKCDDPEKQLTVIDLEYCSYNYRGFDFGNHFCEWCYDYQSEQEMPYFSYYEESYPTKQEQYQFFREYLDAKNEPCTEEALESLYREANTCALASHLMWALWSVVQKDKSDIEFGYLEYAVCRLEAYFKWKMKMFPKEV